MKQLLNITYIFQGHKEKLHTITYLFMTLTLATGIIAIFNWQLITTAVQLSQLMAILNKQFTIVVEHRTK